MATIDELKNLINLYSKTGINDYRRSMLTQMAKQVGVSQDQLQQMINTAQNENQNGSGFITDNQNPNGSGFITDNQNPNGSGFITDNQNPNGSGFITDNQNPNGSGFITEENNQQNISGFTLKNNDNAENKDFTEIKKISSSGAMSELFQAIHLGRRKVIIKRIKPEYRNNKIYRDLFYKEFDNAFSLEHPNIVHIYGKGEDADGPYYYMEYIDGRTLLDVIKKERRNDENFIKKIFLEILDALSYVHKKQIFHRDLKPENIMVTFKGDNVKIIDFGLAGADDLDDNLKRAGTPKYSAPEQLLNATSADQLSDIYSVGMIMIEMLGGEPDRRHLSKIKDEFFRNIADRCTMSNRNDRFKSCDEIIQLINNNLNKNSQPTSVIPDWLAQKIKEYASDGVISKNERKMIDLEIEKSNLDKDAVNTFVNLELEKAYEKLIAQEKTRRQNKPQITSTKTSTPYNKPNSQKNFQNSGSNNIIKKIGIFLLIIVIAFVCFYLIKNSKINDTNTEKIHVVINNKFKKGDILYTTASTLNLRSIASDNGAIVGKYPKGTQVEVFDDQEYTTNDWIGVKVKKDGKLGYMSKKHLSKTKSQ